MRQGKVLQTQTYTSRDTSRHGRCDGELAGARWVRPLIIADVQSADDELRFNINKSTLDNFVTIARDKYGVANSEQYGTFDKKRNSDALFARLDWQINSNNLLTVRDNYTYDNNKLGLQDNTTISLYESFGNDLNIDNSILASLRTKVNEKITNELKVQHLYTYQDSSPGDQLPAYNIPRAVCRIHGGMGHGMGA